MSLSEDLGSALKEAMKAKDKPRLDAIRQIQTEVAKKKAEKGEEVTDEIIDGKQSVVWRQALNRVHAQKSIIKWCLD